MRKVWILMKTNSTKIFCKLRVFYLSILWQTNDKVWPRGYRTRCQSLEHIFLIFSDLNFWCCIMCFDEGIRLIQCHFKAHATILKFSCRACAHSCPMLAFINSFIKYKSGVYQTKIGLTIKLKSTNLRTSLKSIYEWLT